MALLYREERQLRYGWQVPGGYVQGGVTEVEEASAVAMVGLCVRLAGTCARSNRVLMFYLCALSAVDPRFPNYPRLPVLSRAGYAPGLRSEKRSKKADISVSVAQQVTCRMALVAAGFSSNSWMASEVGRMINLIL